MAVAAELAEGIFVAGIPRGFDASAAGRCAALTFGTVLDEGEDPGSERALAAAGHAAAVNLHAAYERGADISRIPGADRWLAELDAVPEHERHILLHDLHLVGMSERDARVVNGDLLRTFGLARTSAEWGSRIEELAAAGVTEIAYQPAGPDIPGELRRFAGAAGL
jgi:5,10-methylenetetrahydromethanopterin reductase